MHLARLKSYRSQKQGGLSLQEMLVVIAVFGILGAIFLISSFAVMTKTKVSRAKHDLRTLQKGLEVFRTDYSRFPSAAKGLNEIAEKGALISKVPSDPFSPDGTQPYRYYIIEGSHPYTNAWLLVSAGPDGVIGIDEEIRNMGEESLNPEAAMTIMASQQGEAVTERNIIPGELIEALRAHSYDPTNGVNSAGDIYLYDLKLIKGLR